MLGKFAKEPKVMHNAMTHESVRYVPRANQLMHGKATRASTTRDLNRPHSSNGMSDLSAGIINGKHERVGSVSNGEKKGSLVTLCGRLSNR